MAYGSWSAPTFALIACAVLIVVAVILPWGPPPRKRRAIRWSVLLPSAVLLAVLTVYAWQVTTGETTNIGRERFAYSEVALGGLGVVLCTIAVVIRFVVGRRSLRRFAQGLLSLLLVLALAAGALLWFGQRYLIYFPDSNAQPSVSAVAKNGEDIRLRTSDGLDLSAWRLNPAKTKSQPKAKTAAGHGLAVLYLPGNGGSRATRLDVGQAIAKRGFTVLLTDYRGFGGNRGNPSEGGLVRDARAGLDYLNRAGFADGHVVIVGESIGTGVAAQLAVSRPPGALLLRSPFTSLPAVASWLYPAPAARFVRDRFDTLSALHRIECPVTVLAGTADTLVPEAQSREVADRAHHLHRYAAVKGADHVSGVWWGDYMAGQVADLAGTIPRH